MNRILFLLFFFFAAASFADEGNPADFCHSAGCSPAMIEIIKHYQDASILRTSSALDGFSGACYHLDPSYDPSYKHYGGFVFETDANTLSAAGLFSFFYQQDPYAGMNSADMKKRILAAGSNFKNLIVGSSQLELSYVTDNSDTHYWFRGQDDELYLIGRQASSGSEATLVFCDMHRH